MDFICCEHCIINNRRIDIFLRFKTDKELYAIAIENKMWAKDQPDQLKDYNQHLKKDFSGRYTLIYLNLWGKDPSTESILNTNEIEHYVNINYWKELIDLIEKWSLQCKAENVRYFLNDFKNYLNKIINGETFMNEIESVSDFATQSADKVETAFAVINAAGEIKETLFYKFKEQLKEIAKDLNLKDENSIEKFNLPDSRKDDPSIELKIESSEFDISFGFEEYKFWIGVTTDKIFEAKSLIGNDQLLSDKIIDQLKGDFDNIKSDPGWLFSYFIMIYKTGIIAPKFGFKSLMEI